MDNKNFLKDIYDDFFGIEKLKEENERLAKEVGLTDDYPTIDVQKIEDEKELKKSKDEQMVKFYEDIDKLYVTDEAKNILKRMIDYMRKYNEKIEEAYIPFNLCVYTDNEETLEGITNTIGDAAIYFSYIPQGATVETSMYDVDKVDQIDKIYDKENSVIVLSDWEGLTGKDVNFKSQVLHRLEDIIKARNNTALTILTTKNKDRLTQAFDGNIEIKDNNFDFEIQGIKPDVQDVYEEILEKLKNNKMADNFKIKLLDYITATYTITEMSYPEYRDKLCNKILFNKGEELDENDVPEYEKEKTMEEIFAELNELVGLQKVKQVLNELVNLMEFKAKTDGEFKIKDTNLHMVFLGNPGTGKTTVARIIVQILYNLKYIKQNKLIEVSSKDLVGEYVGQTAPKTMSVVEKALGGVLFIDEAYSLASGSGMHGNSYNEEAIATLIQAMENNRDNLVVIFAGYTKEMQAFLNANSGIVSRIGYVLEFDDYTEKELVQIFEGMIRKAGFDITQAALDRAEEIIVEYKDSKNFGNARFARNLYEKTVIRHSVNTKNKKSKKAIKTIQAEDINADNLIKQ